MDISHLKIGSGLAGKHGSIPKLTQQGSLMAGLFLPVEPTMGQQKPTCHLNLGNLMDVQERHIPNRKCRDSG
ncbi:hypothetical protein J6590_105602, partial [Homalodisca vitripennis]